MKIINRTHWRTDQIRGIAQIVAKDQLLEAAQIKALIITVDYRRKGQRRIGEATLGCSVARVARRMSLFMQRDKVDSVLLAHVIAHEIGHLKGLEHRHMRGRIAYDYVNGWRSHYAWASYLPVEQRPERPRIIKPAPTAAEMTAAKLEAVAAMVAKWQTKVKRATTMLKKWERKQRYYGRKVAAINQPKESSVN